MLVLDERSSMLRGCLINETSLIKYLVLLPGFHFEWSSFDTRHFLRLMSDAVLLKRLIKIKKYILQIFDDEVGLNVSVARKPRSVI